MSGVTALVQRATSRLTRSYFDSGLVTLNSDDPPMFGANLLDKYVLTHDQYVFTPDQLREPLPTSIRGGSIAAHAAEASFLPPHEKPNLLSRIEQYR